MLKNSLLGKNNGMEYLIASVLTLIFLAVYIITKRKPREHFTHTLNDEKYTETCGLTARKFGQASESGKCQYDGKPFYKTIKKAMKVCKKSKCEDFREFLPYFEFAKNVAKKNKTFETLCDLPCVDDETRVVTMARLCLESCDFMLIEDKVATVFNDFNKISTVSFPEVDLMKDGFLYVYLEKAAFLGKRLITLDKIHKIAKKISTNPKRFEKSKQYLRLKDNNVFLHFSSNEREESVQIADAVYLDVLNSTKRVLSNIADGINSLDLFSFYRFYRPLEILEGYDVFKNANNVAKKEFLKNLSCQSTKLNLDEYCYTLVIDGYMKRVAPPAITAKKVGLGVGTIFTLYKKNDMLTLASALSSNEMMSILYLNPQKNEKSILQNVKIKNTFAPYTQQKTVKFGISIGNDNLTLSPSIPSDFAKIEFDLLSKGISHHITILPSDNKILSVNGTVMTGVPCVKLGKIPLKIVLKTPFSE